MYSAGTQWINQKLAAMGQVIEEFAKMPHLQNIIVTSNSQKVQHYNENLQSWLIVDWRFYYYCVLYLPLFQQRLNISVWLHKHRTLIL